ncbi:HNH endonuclease [Paenibacillus sp. 7124]|uniref:HNH endonuclease n=1 Tax=Paenibacillus apii TaxID=1850370 RepID=A0A6M1PD95_9BACL|nr:HNH endonuclease [Paenibacillus apii]NGM81239.1 HNH endonuclease [Paenibacillus apii]
MDDEDYGKLSSHKWCYDRKGYAVRSAPVDGKWTSLYMHRQITECPEGLVVDHINRDGLDNRRDNLRVCRREDNARNNNGRSHNTSGYKGVTWHKQARKWAAQLTSKGVHYHLGLHATKESAARAYNAKAAELFGEFATLNEILENTYEEAV